MNSKRLRVTLPVLPHASSKGCQTLVSTPKNRSFVSLGWGHAAPGQRLRS